MFVSVALFSLSTSYSCLETTHANLEDANPFMLVDPTTFALTDRVGQFELLVNMV